MLDIFIVEIILQYLKVLNIVLAIEMYIRNQPYLNYLNFNSYLYYSRFQFT